MFKSKQLYVQVRPGEMIASVVPSGPRCERKCSALSHPRTLMGEFVEIEKTLTSLVHELSPKTWLSVAPVITLHLLGTEEGGYTNVEVRAFKEAALGAGARAVLMPSGQTPLSENAILQKQYSELVGV